MELTDEQKTKVSQWIADGLKLSEIQQRLGEEEGMNLTYMDVRFLVDDLRLTPRDIVVPDPVVPSADSALVGGAAPAPASVASNLSPDGVSPEPSIGGGVKVKVDQITRPGAMISGSVTFSDGKSAAWYLDQTGRLGMVADEQGYRPSQGDVADFQMALEKELAGLGM